MLGSMGEYNFVDFYRWSNQMEDVFIEDGHFLYACSEPFDKPWMMSVCEYRPIPLAGMSSLPESVSDWEWIRGDVSGADTAYLQTLEPAPVKIASCVLLQEFEHDYGHMDYDEFAALLDVKAGNLIYDAMQIRRREYEEAYL